MAAPVVDPNNPYGLLGGGTPKLGNGSTYVPPMFNNMGDWFGYATLNDQQHDAQIQSSNGAGMFANNASPVLQSIKNSQPMVGGGLLGATAYSGNNPWTGFDPYAGRGNGAPGAGPPGAGGPPPPGLPNTGGPGGYTPPGFPPGVVPPRINPGTGQPYPGGGTPAPGTPYQPTPNPGHPGGGNPTPPALQPPNAPVTGHTLNPSPTVTAPPSPRSTQGGLLGPTSGGNNPVYPTVPKYDPAQLNVPGAVQGQTDPSAMAAYFMTLPPEQRGDYFNAISQYGLTKGQNLGGALDAALRQTMGDSQFKAWLQSMDNGQGSTIKGTAGLPDWLMKGLGG